MWYNSHPITKQVYSCKNLIYLHSFDNFSGVIHLFLVLSGDQKWVDR